MRAHYDGRADREERRLSLIEAFDLDPSLTYAEVVSLYNAGRLHQPTLPDVP